jgi:hypothetical protein
LVSSLNIDDIIGQTYAIYIIVVAGAESAIGLGILVAFYRLIKFPVKNPRPNYSYSHFNLLPAISCRLCLIPRRGISNLEAKHASPQLRNYSSERKIVLSPLFISGFSDAEGSFVVTILKNPRYKIG